MVNLLQLRGAFYRDAAGLRSLRAACTDLFAARYAEAEQLQLEPRSWPPRFVAYPHWQRDCTSAAAEVAIAAGLDDAVGQLNGWIAEIDATP